MRTKHNIDEITQYLNQTLTEYEVIPANFGWHIHKGNTYYGLLEYQGTKGWKGSAFTQLPSELKEQLKRFGQSVPSVFQVAA